MPLTTQPTVLEGGCNCRAVRYRVSVPIQDSRPFYPIGGKESTPPVRMPVVCTDHCNDCRSATGSLLPCWLLNPMEMVSISLVDVAAVPSNDQGGRLDETIQRRPWQPAIEIFHAQNADSTTFLSFFASSKARRRSFCTRCGTNLSYNIFPVPDRLPFPMLDVVLGTVDRPHLENLSLERQLWWDCGIEWVQQFSTHGLSVPIHPRSGLGTDISEPKAYEHA